MKEDNNVEINKGLVDKIMAALPEKVRKMLPDDEIELFERLSLLPKDKATGTVIKVLIDGNLDKDGQETALLYMLKGSSIKPHEHTTETGKEVYVAIAGELKMEGVSLDANICNVGMEHWIDEVEEDTIIGTYKTKEIKKEIEDIER